MRKFLTALALTAGAVGAASADDVTVNGTVDPFCSFGSATAGTMPPVAGVLSTRNAGGSAGSITVSNNYDLGVQITSSLALTKDGSTFSTTAEHDTSVTAGPNSGATPSGTVSAGSSGTLILSGPGNDTVAVHARVASDDVARPLAAGAYVATVTLTCAAPV